MPPIYSEKLTDEQNLLFAGFERRTSIRPIFLEQLDQGLFSPEQVWKINLGMLENILADLRRMNFPE